MTKFLAGCPFKNKSQSIILGKFVFNNYRGLKTRRGTQILKMSCQITSVKNEAKVYIILTERQKTEL